MSGAELALAARSLVGAPFRLRGRDPVSGLDCLGVLATALALIGYRVRLPESYALRRRGDLDADAIAKAMGLSPASGSMLAGDVLLVRCSAVQLHLLIAAGEERFVHAHAGLGRVVVGPADPSWPVLGRWRIPSSQQD